MAEKHRHASHALRYAVQGAAKSSRAFFEKSKSQSKNAPRTNEKHIYLVFVAPFN
jgi:hypothetical protein